MQFHQYLIETIIGGRSAIDIPRLEIHNLDQAYKFAMGYGYDLNDSQDLEEVWSFHRRSVALIREELLNPDEEIPAELADPARLQDVGFLFVFASDKSRATERVKLQRWSCAILRVMHVLSHIDNDLFSNFSEEIQEQILKPFRDHMVNDPVSGIMLGLANDVDQIPIHRFDVKTFKSRTSSVVKLLSKPQTVAFHLLDKMGVRFVTKTTVDAFRAVRLLHREGLVCFANVMPDQSRNTLYPVNLLVETLDRVPRYTTTSELDEMLKKALIESPDKIHFLEKKNEFSSQDYRTIKFIARKLIHIPVGEKDVHFFFPFEVQIMDYDNYVKILSGPGSHEEYKKRQREAARARVLPQTP